MITVPETIEQYDHHRGAAPLLRPGGSWRKGAIVMLNLICYAAANAFWRYLGTGQWLDFSLRGYYQDLLTPLGESFLHPLNVLSYPWMILTAGIILAAILVVPILTAVLYHLPLTAMFIIVVGVFGHAPILSVSLAVGCVVAARTPLRSDTPFLAAVLGLLPVGLYLYLFAFGGARTAEVLPLQRWVVISPLFVAVIVSILAAGAVLGLARVTKFRPGAICPVLVILLAGSMMIFYRQVGVHELDFALITRNLAPGDMVFQPIKLKTWSTRHNIEGLNPQTLEIHIRDHLQGLREELAGKCQDYLVRHGESSRAAEVLWIMSQTRSLQLDVPALKAGTVRYSASFPRPASGVVWRGIRAEHPGAPQAALADYRLAQLALREKNITEAEERLHLAEESLAKYVAAQNDLSEIETEGMILQKPECIPSESYYPEVLFRVRRMIWLMKSNDASGDPKVGEALAALFNENPSELDYDERLGKLVSLYEKTRLGDNLKLDVAMATLDPYAQAEMLIWLAEDERTDAAIEANYQLGTLAMQTARAHALLLIPKLMTPQQYFKIVIAAPPNPWQELAAEHLGRLKKQPGGDTESHGT